MPAATEPPYDQVRVRKDYSYWKKSFWRPGMALVGDAACFVDPVLSSGVHLATYGALLAARSINACLAGDVPEERGFAEFEARYRREYGVFYEFLIAFYDMQSDEQSYFWQAKKVTNVDATEAGRVRRAGRRAGVGRRRRWPPAGRGRGPRRRGGTLATAGDRSQPAGRLTAVGETFRHGSDLQEQALYGAPLDDTEPPVPGGLALAKDGLGWIA